MSDLRENSLFRVLSGTSGWSLLAVGLLSLGVSIYANALAGICVSLAVTLHGTLELLLRKRVLSEFRPSGLRSLSLNQLGLAASASLYFAYQAIALDVNALYAMATKPPIADALALYPEELRLQVMDALPFLAGMFYAIAAAVTWIACGVTALYYWRLGSRVFE